MYCWTCIGLVLTGCVTGSSASECWFFPGDMVHLHCSTEPDHVIRLYRGSDDSDVIYSAKTLRRNGPIGNRYSVYDDGNGTVDLSILTVKNDEAGIYRCQDMNTNEDSSINLVIDESRKHSTESANQQHLRRCSFALRVRDEAKRSYPNNQAQLNGSVIQSSTQRIELNLPEADSAEHWLSSDHLVKGSVIVAVTAAIAIVTVVVLILLAVIGCMCCKNRPMRQEPERQGYRNRALSQSVDLPYDALIKPSSHQTQPVYAQLQGTSNLPGNSQDSREQSHFEPVALV